MFRLLTALFIAAMVIGCTCNCHKEPKISRNKTSKKDKFFAEYYEAPDAQVRHSKE